MKILITGGTGFIGSALCARLLQDEHQLLVLSRHPEKVSPPIQAISSLDQIDANTAFDSVINLAGEPIANKRWSEAQKALILSSRIDTTKQLVRYFERASHKPHSFVSGSAIGYYGMDVSSDPIDETGSGDNSFSSTLCQRWESIAIQAQQMGIRTCLLRTGIVLGHGGALSKMVPPFKLGLGGLIGGGDQWMPWIHIDDLIGIILHCIEENSVQGAINGTAPNPISNKEFTQALGRVLKRPTIFSMPSILVKVLMGQMGDELLLSGKRVLPLKALNTGYKFKYENVQDALLAIV